VFQAEANVALVSVVKGGGGHHVSSPCPAIRKTDRIRAYMSAYSPNFGLGYKATSRSAGQIAVRVDTVGPGLRES